MKGKIDISKAPREVVPDNFYSVLQIASYENITPRWMAQMAQLTLDNILKLAKEQGLVDKNGHPRYSVLPKLFNTIRNGYCTDKTINVFLQDQDLEPFGYMFRLFFKRQMAAGNDLTTVYYGDFGIRKTIYERYKETKKPPPYLNQGKVSKYDTLARDGRSKVELPDGGRIDVPMNAVYRQFKAGIAACNAMGGQKVTVPEMVIAAMREYMQKRPDIFGNVEVKIDERKLSSKKSKSIKVDIEPKLINSIHRFLQRYNKTHTPGLSQQEFILIAIQAQLERMPLDLVAPELVAQLREMEKME